MKDLGMQSHHFLSKKGVFRGMYRITGGTVFANLLGTRSNRYPLEDVLAALDTRSAHV